MLSTSPDLADLQGTGGGWQEIQGDSQGAPGFSTVHFIPQTDTEDDHPILRKETEAAVQLLKKGKPAGVDNILAELVQAGGEDEIAALTIICKKIRQTGE